MFQFRHVASALGTIIIAKQIPIIKSKVSAKEDYKWDFNWDHRQVPENATDEEKSKYGATATRRIYMIRHGQYEDGAKDSDRCLSEKGREQARLCGEYLKTHIFNSDKTQLTQFVHSTMNRATETARIINSVLNVESCKIESCDLIREGCPVEPEPPLKNWPGKPWLEFKEAPRIEAGFRKYIRRAKPESKSTERALIVCHGNVIRYFLCRGLQLPPTAWLHISLPHCSISQLHCRPSGTVGTMAVGECGFLPPHLQTVVNEKSN